VNREKLLLICDIILKYKPDQFKESWNSIYRLHFLFLIEARFLFNYHLFLNSRFANLLQDFCSHLWYLRLLTNCIAGSYTSNATDFRNSAETFLVLNDIYSEIITPKLEFPPGH